MKFVKSLAVSALALAVAAPAVAQDWAPRKPVEFIIMAGTGGGADQIARVHSDQQARRFGRGSASVSSGQGG